MVLYFALYRLFCLAKQLLMAEEIRLLAYGVFVVHGKLGGC